MGRSAPMTLFLQQLIVGVSTGAIYALIALGYTMVYGSIELINFAHGDIFMIGTFVVISMLGVLGVTTGTSLTGWPLISTMIIALVGSMLVCAVMGVVIERFAYRPLRNAPRIAPLISAIGVSLILEDVGKLWKGINFVSFPQYFPSQNFHIGPPGGGVDISSVNILVIIVAVDLWVGVPGVGCRRRTPGANRPVGAGRGGACGLGGEGGGLISTELCLVVG